MNNTATEALPNRYGANASFLGYRSYGNIVTNIEMS
jgi:hypothetical protein